MPTASSPKAKSKTNFARKTSKKIVHVFQNRIEEEKYSRRVPISVIETENDWNLNLRRYVDNTPPRSQRTCVAICTAACLERK